MEKSTNWNNFGADLVNSQIEYEGYRTEEASHIKCDTFQQQDDNHSEQSDELSDEEFESESEALSDLEEEIKPWVIKTRKRPNDAESEDDDEQEEDKPKPKRKSSKPKVQKEKIVDPETEEQILVENEKIKQFCKMECDLCAEKFITMDNVREHYRTIHKQRWYLMCCNFKFKTRALILRHIKRHTIPDTHKFVDLINWFLLSFHRLYFYFLLFRVSQM